MKAGTSRSRSISSGFSANRLAAWACCSSGAEVPNAVAKISGVVAWQRLVGRILREFRKTRLRRHRRGLLIREELFEALDFGCNHISRLHDRSRCRDKHRAFILVLARLVPFLVFAHEARSGRLGRERRSGSRRFFARGLDSDGLAHPAVSGNDGHGKNRRFPRR